MGLVGIVHGRSAQVLAIVHLVAQIRLPALVKRVCLRPALHSDSHKVCLLVVWLTVLIELWSR